MAENTQQKEKLRQSEERLHKIQREHRETLMNVQIEVEQ
jgi:hypothetical protein